MNGNDGQALIERLLKMISICEEQLDSLGNEPEERENISYIEGKIKGLRISIELIEDAIGDEEEYIF